MSLYGLGFGNDVDYTFLDVMSRENKGLARRIYTDSDAALQLQVESLSYEAVDCVPCHVLPQLCTQNGCVYLSQGFYDEVSSPLLLDVDLHYPANAVESLTTNHFSHLFNGSEIIVAGQLTDNDIDNFLVEVNGLGVSEGRWLEFIPEMESRQTLMMNHNVFFFICSLMTLMSKDSSVPWTGVDCTQKTITFLGILLSVSGPTSPSSSSWRKRQSICQIKNGCIHRRCLIWQLSPFPVLQQDRQCRWESQRHGQSPGHVSEIQLRHPPHLHGGHQAWKGRQSCDCWQADWRWCRDLDYGSLKQMFCLQKWKKENHNVSKEKCSGFFLLFNSAKTRTSIEKQ